MEGKHRYHIAFMGMGLIALLAALWAGLVRAGWSLPVLIQTLPGEHGPLMVWGFAGMLICLERTATLDRRVAYAAPLLAGVGALGLVAGLSTPAKVLIAIANVALILVLILLEEHHHTISTQTMLLGAILWTGGNFFWLADRSIFQFVPWWLSALVIIVIGERMRYGRMLHLPKLADIPFAVSVVAIVLGLFVAIADESTGIRVMGLGMLGVGLWAIREDSARRQVRESGDLRYTSISAVLAYIWLVLGGILALAFGLPTSALGYDALLHTILLGFVVTMIFGHVPVIFPGILGRDVPFHTAAYFHLLLLQFSLLLRIGGDLLNSPAGRQWGALLNVLALLLFIVNTVRTVLDTFRRESPAAA